MTATKCHQPASELRTIWRFWVINTDTRHLLGEARSSGNPREGTLDTEYRFTDSGFHALLGSPNGKAVVQMLTDHCNAPERKTIARVRVLEGIHFYSPPTFYFVLADSPVAATKSKRSVAGQRRDTAKRQELGQS